MEAVSMTLASVALLMLFRAVASMPNRLALRTSYMVDLNMEENLKFYGHIYRLALSSEPPIQLSRWEKVLQCGMEAFHWQRL